MERRSRASSGLTPRRVLLLPLRVARAALALALPVLFVAGIAFVRSGGISGAEPVTGPEVEVPSDATAHTRLSAAATAIETALAKGGGGIRFEIVQTQVIHAREGGPKLELHDPADRDKVLGYTDTLPVGTLIERGFATPTGFWSELVHGPEPGAEKAFDLATAEPARQALVRGGTRYRNDGEGWHEADVLPGIGLDPETIELLPALLRDTGDATEVALVAEADPAFAIMGLAGPAQPATRALDATSEVRNVPGVIAADLAPATELLGPTAFGLDDAGRLVSLTITARNTNMEGYDLVVSTVVTLRYPDTPPPLPEPLPAWQAPVPASDGEPVR